ncbi:MAG: DASH family cryptochrome [Calothrix sp. MO_167.B42]|nr:DASH family cryptochrome [Calothrix sp. MO_167.B42]
MNEKRILIWYRHDLRLQDHEPMYRAIEQKAQVIPVYCFDERQFGKTSFGFPKTGAFRAQFLLESVADLRNSLLELGSNLVVRRGFPEEIIPSLAQELEISAVYFHGEVTSEELAVESALQTALSQISVPCDRFWGTTVYHPDNLPFAVEEIPELFTNFRKSVEKKSLVDSCFLAPQKLPQLPDIDGGELPNLSELGLEPPKFDPRAVLQFKGGETAGLTRLDNYIWLQNCLKDYKQTRNGMLGADYSSKFSPWLALGCLSPRFIYEQVKKYEAERVKNDSTYWLVFELLWRDFFRFICAKHGNHIFRQSGLQGIRIPGKEDWERFRLWQSGMTGFPLVDANMRELAATGFMSNRGRQNVASFLTKNLGINWQMGAEWFESLLIDYDVCSNWGNWNYTAGVGNDARGFRYFNIPKQSRDYDPQGEYIKHWLTELTPIKGNLIHEPGKLSAEEQKHFGVRLGVDYPRPIVDFFKSVKANEKIYNAALELRQK